MVSFDGVGFRYRRRAPLVLEGFTWQPGHREALLGPNGAGKSTVLQLASGALLPASGSVVTDTSGSPAYLPQATIPVGSLTAREQVALAGWMQGMARHEAWSASARVLDRVGLGERRDRRVRDLSGGQLRRVGIAEVLVSGPTAAFLDEPAVGLDPLQRAQLREVLLDIDLEQLVISTHQVDDIEQLVDTVTVMASGRVLFQGSVSDFLNLGGPDDDGADRAGLPAERAYARLLGDGGAA